MSAIRNSGVSVFEGVVKCAINGIYCSDYALCPHYSVSPHFRGVRREGFHCTCVYRNTHLLSCITAGSASSFMAVLMAIAGVSCTSLATVITVQREYCKIFQLLSLNLACLVVCEQIEEVRMWM